MVEELGQRNRLTVSVRTWTTGGIIRSMFQTSYNWAYYNQLGYSRTPSALGEAMSVSPPPEYFEHIYLVIREVQAAYSSRGAGRNSALHLWMPATFRT